MPDGPAAIPERVSRYRILGRLGSGGMGDVYAGLDETLQRRVALKAIQADRRLNTESQERFLREARILSQLDHPNICRAYDYIAGADSDWLVMERVDGRSLADRLKHGPLGPEAATIAAQIAGVLVVTHAAGIVHRDLKPSNVMITPSGDAKVLDFGIARLGEPGTPSAPHARDAAPAVASSVAAGAAADTDTTHTSDPLSTPAADADATRFQTRLDSTIGTLPYMSPEQARGETATPASDMFAFGLLLQEMLTGRRAYPAGPELVDRVRQARTEPIAESDDLVKLVRRLTSLAPSHRPTAVEAVDRLRWIRDAPKRRVRRAIAAAAALLVVLAGLKYTVDLQRERTAAVLARDDANRRRGQAEDLIGFMLGDLRTKLEKAARLDLLEAVGGQAMTYFAAVPAASLTGEELSRRAQAIYQIGAVRQARGDLKAARAAYDESLTVAAQVAARDPSNTDWQLRLATAHFYAGDIRRRESDLPGAMREFEAYRDIAAGLVARDPGNQIWNLELSYAQGGIAAVQELQGDLDGARQALELALEVKARIAAGDPQNAARQKDLGTAHNRLGVVLDKLGEASAAGDHYASDLAIRRALVEHAPGDQSLKRDLARAMDFVAQSHEDAGHLPSALTQYQAAFDVIAPLAASDSSNKDWQRDLATAERRLGDVLHEMGRGNDARARYLRARATLAPIAAAALTDITRQRDVAKIELGLGAVELGRGALHAAGESGASVERLLRAAYAKTPDGLTAPLLAEGQLLSAEAAARSGDVTGARAFREAALALARGVSGGFRSSRVRADEARALLALGRIAEARPIVTELWRLGYRHPLLAQAWAAAGGERLGPG